MEKEFIPYEQALELKELGFKEECFKQHYHNITSDLVHITNDLDCGIPTFSQAFRWFRENHNIISYTKIYMIVDGVDEYHYEIKIDKIRLHRENPMYTFNTYEEAELACLKKLIEIVKTK